MFDKTIVGISLNGLSFPQCYLSVWNFIWKNSNEMKKTTKFSEIHPIIYFSVITCQPTFTCTKSTIVTLEKSVKYVQS